jgi:NADH-quinone oxidoreductase subunit L
MLVGALAIAGIPILSGFFSKDEILWRTWQSGHPVMWAAGAAAAALTAFYMFRLVYLAFHGGFRGTSEQAHHLRESPPSMVVPLVVLAILSIAGGWVGIPHSLGQFAGIPNYFESWLAPALAEAPASGPAPVSIEEALRTRVHGTLRSTVGSGEANADGARPSGSETTTGRAMSAPGATGSGTEYAFMLLAIAIAVAGILVARTFYRKPSDLPARAAGAAGPLYGLVANKYWVDELYDATVLRAYYRTCDAFAAIDHWVVDGIVNVVGAFTELVGQVLRFFQTGFVRNYALFVFAGAVLLVWLLGR